jgi:hypothetical protein
MWWMTSMAQAIQALAGMRLAVIRRIANLVIVVFRPDEGADHTIHAQCSFRVLHGDVILLGSRDMHWPQVHGADRDEAFENLATKYDSQAEYLTSTLAERDFRVSAAGLGPGGLVTVEAADETDFLRLEFVPETSGPKVESWRLFALGGSDEHHVYPEAAGRD